MVDTIQNQGLGFKRESVALATNSVDLNAKVIPFFSGGIWQVKAFEYISLCDLFEKVRGNTYQKQVALIRSLSKKNERDEAKAKLDYVCVSVKFGNRRSGKNSLRHDGNVEEHTFLIQIDFDPSKDGRPLNVEAIKKILKEFSYIVGIFDGPSGTGVKAIAAVKASVDNHGAAWKALRNALWYATGYWIDFKTETLVIPCYLSHDPDTWINPTPKYVDFRLSDEEGRQASEEGKNGKISGKRSRRNIGPILPPDFTKGKWVKIREIPKAEFESTVKSSIIWALPNRRHRTRKDEHPARCPACGTDTNEGSFSYTPSKGKFGVAKCHRAKCSKGWSGRKLARDLKVWDNEKGIFIPLNSPEIPDPDLADRKVTYAPDYIYRDPETKEILGGKKIMHRGFNEEKQKRDKFAVWLSPAGDAWEQGLNGKEIHFLYNLHLAADKSVIFLAEGEKKVESLNKLIRETQYPQGLAISLPHGAKTRINPINFPYLKGKKIYILPDYDESGQGQFCSIANYFLLQKNGINAEILDFANEPVPFSGYDIEDKLLADEKQGIGCLQTLKWLKGLVKKHKSHQSIAFVRRYGFLRQEDGSINVEVPFLNQILNNGNTPKYLLLESTQGTGKSTLAKELTKNSGPVIAIVHRKSLASQIAKQCKWKDYRELKVNPESGKYLIEEPRIVITLDSLWKLPLECFAECTLILDEVDQLAAHVFNSTCRKYRIEILKAFTYIMENAKSILAMSADIDSSVHKLLAISGKEFVHIRNLYRSQRKAIEVARKEKLIELILQSLENGERAAIPCSEKSTANKILQLLSTKYPEKKFLNINADTAQYRTHQMAMENPELLKQYDAVIYSPAIFTGVDFNVGGFDKVYLIAEDNKLRATDLVQAAARFRQAKELYYYVVNKSGRKETDKEILWKQVISKGQASVNARGPSAYELLVPHIGISADSEVNHHFQHWFDVFLEVLSETNQQTNHLKYKFEAVLRKRGYVFSRDLDIVTGECHHALKEAGEAFEREHRGKVLSAMEIDQFEYDSIKDKGPKNPEELYQKERYALQEANGGEEELETAYDIPNFASAIRELEKFKAGQEYNRELDAKHPERLIIDEPINALFFSIRSEVTSWPEIQKLMRGGEISKADYPPLVERIQDKASWLSHLGFKAASTQHRKNKETGEYEDIETPMPFLSPFFRQLGYKIRKHGKNDNRRYTLCQERIAFLERALCRRLEARQRPQKTGIFPDLSAA